jgi:dipeptidyl aminopeptidase/acylaminoacyl peptidase
MVANGIVRHDELTMIIFRACWFYLLAVCGLLAGCALASQPAWPQTVGTPAPLPTIQPALAPPTPDRYAGLTIADLTARAYGEGELRVEQVLEVTATFTRTLITFPSDGLTVYGFMNIPQGEGPFPVVIVNHGYIDPAVYRTLAYTTRYADALASAGFIAIHPNLRGYPPSQEGPNEFRTGFAIDVLNLAAQVRKQAGQPGPLAQADGQSIGLWGHSMGGGVTIRSLVVDPQIKAAVLYGAMSGDEARNHERILFFSNGQRGQWEEGEDPSLADLQRISPIYYLDRITAAVSIHHGELDDQVPVAWSVELCEQLQALAKPVECFFYPGGPHTFTGPTDALFIQRMIEFFRRELTAEATPP